MHNQNWFEMKDVQRRKLAESVWIPLRAYDHLIKEGTYGYEDHRLELFGLGSILVPADKRDEVGQIDWHSLGLGSSASATKGFDGQYYRAEIDTFNDIECTRPVLDHSPGGADVWYLNQDIVIALNLLQEGDSWTRPNEGYVEVARILRNESGAPKRLEIKAEFLKDYMSARNMALRVTWYHERRATFVPDSTPVSWAKTQEAETEDCLWRGRIWDITKGSGDIYGASWAVMNVSRTDEGVDDDVPKLGPENNENVKIEKDEFVRTGKKLVNVEGEVWKNEWILPAAISPRCSYDKEPPVISFYTDGSGKRETKETISDEPQWLWFKQESLAAFHNMRGGYISWYTAETGGVGMEGFKSIHFGINDIGLVTVYAADITSLPNWYQQIWSGFNVVPDGKVSKELISAQMHTVVAKTKAPEVLLSHVMNKMDEMFQAVRGSDFFKRHDKQDDISANVQRYLAQTDEGFYAVAKDLARLVIERLDGTVLEGIVKAPSGTKVGSLKHLQLVLASDVGDDAAYTIMSPLFGLYDFRLLDSHLPSADIDKAYKATGLDATLPPQQRARELIGICANTLNRIGAILSRVIERG